MRMKHVAVATVGALILALSTVTPAIAETEEGKPAVLSNSSRAELISPREPQGFSEHAVLQFLVLGDGPVEDATPGLAASLGFLPFPEEADRAAADALIVAYMAAEPETVSKVTTAVQTGDPSRVDAGLELFINSFDQYVLDLYTDATAQMEQKGPGMQPMGNTWTVTETWLAAGAVVAAGVMLVAGGVVVVVTAGAAVVALLAVYLPGMEGESSTLEKDNLVSQISDGLR